MGKTYKTWLVSMEHRTTGLKTMVTVHESDAVAAGQKADVLGDAWTITGIVEIPPAVGGEQETVVAEQERNTILVQVPDTSGMSPGETLKTIRMSTGLGQAAFGQAVFGIRGKTISSWEREERDPPPYLLSLIRFYVEHGGCLEQESNKTQN